MQLLEMQGMLAGKCLPGDMLVKESLAEYLLRKINERNELAAKLEIVNGLMDATTELNNLAKENVEKLVAENVALKDIVGLTVNNLYASGYEAKQNSMHPWESLIFEGEKVMNTPTTDAAIAEIKASELDDLARSIMEYAPAIESDEYHVY